MYKKLQLQKAKKILALHRDPKLLVLRNIWDPLRIKTALNAGNDIVF